MTERPSARTLPGGASLPRVVGLGGAVMMGLGSILGTGVFVTIGIAAGIAGPAVILAIAIAAVIAAANGLSSAQLAANHPVSGGTYEYGYRYLNPQLGFTAGWMFLLAKSASAATAALGFAGYLFAVMDPPTAPDHRYVAFAAVVLLTILVLAGVRRSNRANIVLVLITIAALLFFIAINLPNFQLRPVTVAPDAPGSLADVLQATALMFVAFTGYGRIATLGEEVREPRRTIPRAILITLLVSAFLYLAVAWTGLSRGLDSRTSTPRTAPLVDIANDHGRWAALIVSIGAITAMLGVLLNLILGLSRVALAMGRRGDLPGVLGTLDAKGQTPTAAVIFVGVVIAGLTLIGDVKATWSFSAFTVLIYYAITNLAALTLPPEQRLYPRWLAVFGLMGCAFLAFWVEPRIWMIGVGLIVAGLVWHAAMRRTR